MKRALELLEGKAKWQAMTRDEKIQERQCHRQKLIFHFRKCQKNNQNTHGFTVQCSRKAITDTPAHHTVTLRQYLIIEGYITPTLSLLK